ncbi:MAG: methionine synthase [Bacteroidales bacterium]|nr:methionine synthase [Bacteroidales bacterium]
MHKKDIRQELARRILILDGAMGTMIQRYRLTEEDFRGSLMKVCPKNLRGNNDILSLTRPEVISEIHEAYLDAGADIIETNTFNATAISQADYAMEGFVYEMNLVSAQLAAECAARFTRMDTSKPRYVAGSIGPTSKSASFSPDVVNPGFREKGFDDFYEAYKEQIRGLYDGGADLLIIETVFDTLNAKAAMKAAMDWFDECGKSLPIIVSGTITDKSGRTLSGQSLEAFLYSVSHVQLLAVGLNCALGARELRPFAKELSARSHFNTCIYPNAGLPDPLGEYKETPGIMGSLLNEFVENGWVNIIGGCCGTTPDHIREMARICKGMAPRTLPPPPDYLRLCGLDPLPVYRGSNFINIGERTNVAGSNRFARLIREENYEDAIEVARQQVENGAQMIDVNVDDAMINGRQAITSFLRYLSAEPDISRVPVVIDSSDWKIIEAGLKCLQGKGMVNSLSLKDGEEEFRKRAVLIKKYGAAMIVMAIDEEGQAVDFNRKTEICRRAYRILTEEAGIPPSDIIFDPNILTIATGMDEHNQYAVDFIRAVEWIKKNLPHVSTSGGISNLSFAFRANQKVREAMHSVFLYHAIRAGLDMGIVNAGMLRVYDDIPDDLRILVTDVVLNRRRDASARLLHYAENIHQEGKTAVKEGEWRSLPVKERLIHSLVFGFTDYLEDDIEEARSLYKSALALLEGPLMEGMETVGDRFGSGKMFLPQVIKTSRVMKKAVALLKPYIRQEKALETHISKKKRILLATVKGDVHDIGKNIVRVVLECHNYHVIDLGVMVPAETIIEKAIDERADVIGLSGLITPSLEEMVNVASAMHRNGLHLPLLIGGATTSELHTAVKIAPAFQHPVFYIKDASRCAGVLKKILSEKEGKGFCISETQRYDQIRAGYIQKQGVSTFVSLEEARSNKLKINWKEMAFPTPAFTGIRFFDDYPLEEISRHIDWTFFFHAWRISGKYPAIFGDPVKGREARKLYDDAKALLGEMIQNKMAVAKGVIGIFPAASSGDDVLVFRDQKREEVIERLFFLRNQEQKKPGVPNLCLADFIAPPETGVEDHIGLFIVSAGEGIEKWEKDFRSKNDDYRSIMIRILADRLAEAFAELMHERVRKEFWRYPIYENNATHDLPKEGYQGIHPAPGYPACPDHSEKETIFRLLNAPDHSGVLLTAGFAMSPPASVCGYYFMHPFSRYFSTGKPGHDQMLEYASRKGLSLNKVKGFIGHNLQQVDIS